MSSRRPARLKLREVPISSVTSFSLVTSSEGRCFIIIVFFFFFFPFAGGGSCNREVSPRASFMSSSLLL
jgi:hypothetical protein